MIKIIVGNCLDRLRQLEAASVHCCISSPPYYGLRKYGLAPSVWGGDMACEHVFDEELLQRELRKGAGLEDLGKRHRGGGKKAAKVDQLIAVTGTCRKCGAWRGELGLEPTPEMFVEHLVLVYEEVKRVLRPDGTAWVNLGDSYYSPRYPGGVGENSTINGQESHEQLRIAKRAQRGGLRGNLGYEHNGPEMPHRSAALQGYKPKDIIGIPWMVAFALRKAGWWLRQDVIWQKPNPMPESTTDRCTKSHEYLFMLSPSERYFFDQEAIKEEVSENAHPRKAAGAAAPKHGAKAAEHGSGIRSNVSFAEATSDMVDRRNKRSVWTVEDDSADLLGARPPERERPPWGRRSANKGELAGKRAGAPDMPQSFRAIREQRNKRSVWTVPTQPYADAHFATFPPSLIEPCVLAGTSERGCCPQCAAPFERITAPSDRYLEALGRSFHDHENDGSAGMMQHRGANYQNDMRSNLGLHQKEVETLGWYPTCRCGKLHKLPKYPRSPRLPKTITAEEKDAARKEWRARCAAITVQRRELCKVAASLPVKPAVVLDHFGGAGTTGMVADRFGRDAVLIEFNPGYAVMSAERLRKDGGMLADVVLVDDEGLITDDPVRSAARPGGPPSSRSTLRGNGHLGGGPKQQSIQEAAE
jgi:DNA modification methylase